MKIICNKNALSEGINIVQNAVSQRTSLQVLEGILINAGKDLILTGNDLEIGIETKISAEILEEGRIVINSRIFSDLIRKLPERDVTIEIKNNDTVVIDSEKIHYEVKGMNPDTYPAIQNVNKEKKIIIEQKKLKEMIRKTIFAVSQDESRPVLMGSLLEFDKERITLVSIDGFRLAMRKEETEQENINDGKVIIPGNTLSDVQKIIQENDEKINIYTEKKQIMFEMSNTKIVSRLIEGEYLNYKGIIPQEFETK
jgi:DNA polymerase-3 subunit beta